MNARTIVAIGCLFLVAVSIEVTLKELTEAPSTTQGPNGCGCIPLSRAAPQIVFPITSQPTFPMEGVAAFYFPGGTRCPTCRQIERTAEEAITTRFGEETKHENLSWQIGNCEVPTDKNFLDDVLIADPRSVVGESSSGEWVAWHRTDRVWETRGDVAASSSDVQEGSSSYLREGSQE